MIWIVNNSFAVPNLAHCFYASIDSKRISLNINSFKENVEIDVCINYRTDWQIEQCFEMIKENTMLIIEDCTSTKPLHYYQYEFSPVLFHVEETGWKQYKLVDYNFSNYPVGLECYSENSQVIMPYDSVVKQFSCYNYKLENIKMDIYVDLYEEFYEDFSDLKSLVNLLEEDCNFFVHESIQYCAVVYYDGKVINGLAYEKM